MPVFQRTAMSSSPVTKRRSIKVASLIQGNMDASMGIAQQIRTSEPFYHLGSPYFSKPYAEVNVLHAQIKKMLHDCWVYRVAI